MASDSLTSVWYRLPAGQWSSLISYLAGQVHPADQWCPLDLTLVPTIAELRSLQAFAAQSPVGSFKVAIVPWVDTVRTEVITTLLKLTEEPPPAFQLVLLSESDRILPTLQSRVTRGLVPVGLAETTISAQEASNYAQWQEFFTHLALDSPRQRTEARQALYRLSLVHGTVQQDLVREALAPIYS